MVTEVLPVSGESIAIAVDMLRAGGIIGMPTETVYGLAADAMSERAVRAIFAAKGRPADNPLIAHISDADQLPRLIRGSPSSEASALIRAFWPGPLTLIFRKSDRVPLAVTAGLDTVAVRLPEHPAARLLIDRLESPIAAPSANRSGRPSPTSAAHVLDDFNGLIPLILDAGPSRVGVESAVVDATSLPVRILRPGGVTREMIAGVIGFENVITRGKEAMGEGEAPLSPGMKYRHYSPKGEVIVVRGEPAAAARLISRLYDERPDKSAILALPESIARYGERLALPLGRSGAAEDVAEALFARLRDMDDLGAERVLCEAISEEGVGAAVMNRLLTAASRAIDAE